MTPNEWMGFVIAPLVLIGFALGVAGISHWATRTMRRHDGELLIRHHRIPLNGGMAVVVAIVTAALALVASSQH